MKCEHISRLNVLILCGCLTFIHTLDAHAQTLVPLEQEVQSPLVPPRISRDTVAMSSAFAYIWAEAPDTQVLELVGDFRCRVGTRQLRAKHAVVWITKRQRQDQVPYHDFEIFLWQDAQISEPGQTVTEGPTLFATVATLGGVTLEVDRKAFEAHTDSAVVRDATMVRDAYRAGTLSGSAGTNPFATVTLPTSDDDSRAFFLDASLTSQTIDNETLSIAKDGIYLTIGRPEDATFTEIKSDSAVVFSDGAEASGPTLDIERLRGVYLEGDVTIQRGDGQVRADRVYYDLHNSQALILDAVMRLYISDRQLPLYVRADRARQLSTTQYRAKNVRVSTSEFYTPHYHLGVADMSFATDLQDSDWADDAQGSGGGHYSMEHVTFNLEGWPMLYWPWLSGSFRDGQSPLHSVRISDDNSFGFSLESRWNLFGFLGLAQPRAFRKAYLDLDYFSERGFGVGIDSEYQTDNTYGELLGYYIHDQEDRDDLGPFRDERIDHPNRGRSTWRHRQYFEEDWELTLEGSYISDHNFLEEYFEKEFDDGKDQETYAQLKKQRENWALTLTAEARILNWLTQTERLPELTFRLNAQPLDRLTFYSENRAGIVRHRPDERRLFLSARNNYFDNRVRSGAVMRADTRQEIGLPWTLGPLRLVPFVVGRLTAWDDTPHDGGLFRHMGMVGLRGSAYLSKVLSAVDSDLWDVHGLRHIVKLDFTGWIAAANHSSESLFPFDEEIEGIDGFSGATFGLRQRWQTKRGPENQRHTSDWIVLDLEAGFFDNAQNHERSNGYASYARPEESITSNYISADARWRISDQTILLADANFDLDEKDLDIANVSLAVERTPRFSYFVGWRNIGETDSNLFGLGGNYRASEKHTFAMRSYFDIDRGRTEQFDLTYIRKFPRWYMAFTFALDEIEDNVSVSLAVWPEGFPNVAVGGKRYTGLATSTAIQSSEYPRAQP